jgi:DNA-binding HxlR family transcriptional regulator
MEGRHLMQPGYKQFCPLAMAAELLCTRWTMVLVRELVAGSTRFNDLRRGVPKMSPTLLSQRLKELEAAGIIERTEVKSEKGIFEYQLTKAGKDLRSIVDAMGFWGQKWVEARPSLKNLDPSLLMWDMRRNLNPSPLPDRRTVIQFLYHELPASKRAWWLVIEKDGEVDLCWSDPGFDVDLYVSTDLRTMTSIWMGLTTVAKEREKLALTGDRKIASKMQTWLGLSPFAVERKRAAAQPTLRYSDRSRASGK